MLEKAVSSNIARTREESILNHSTSNEGLLLRDFYNRLQWTLMYDEHTVEYSDSSKCTVSSCFQSKMRNSDSDPIPGRRQFRFLIVFFVSLQFFAHLKQVYAHF